MPYADPEKSFDSAARHLFRHLHDAAMLRRNPLVRPFFADRRYGTEGAALAAIHARIMAQARACCVGETASGAEHQVRRRQTIVTALCAGEPVAQTIARMTDLAAPVLPRTPRHLRAGCARPVRRRGAGRSSGGRSTIRCVCSSSERRRSRTKGSRRKASACWIARGRRIPPGEARSAAQLELSDALVSLGDVARAAKLLASARRHAAERGGDRRAASADDRMLLAEARLAFATGRDAEIGPALDGLADRLIAERRSDEPTLELLIECGTWHCSGARFADARRVLRRAREVAARLGDMSPGQRVALALLKAYAVEDDSDVFDGSYRRFSLALETSIAAGSTRGALEATTGLMGYYASIGRHDAMYAFADRALEIARATEGTRHVLFAAAWIGTTLMKTDRWRDAEQLVFEAERLSAPGTLYWTFVKEAQADFLARTGRYEAAQAAFSAVQDAARKLGNRKWQAIALRDVGLLLSRIGRRRESADSLRQAVALAGDAAGAWSASLTYRAASKVLADPRVERLAKRAAPVATGDRSAHAARPPSAAGSRRSRAFTLSHSSLPRS